MFLMQLITRWRRSTIMALESIKDLDARIVSRRGELDVLTQRSSEKVRF
jgi:hypothetical protein